jgi:hypothetical protein
MWVILSFASKLALVGIRRKENNIRIFGFLKEVLQENNRRL